MAVETLGHPHEGAPLIYGGPKPQTHAPRTVFGCELDSGPIFRSSEPHSYLIPDVEWSALRSCIGHPTSSPIVIGMDPHGLTIRVSAPEEAAVRILHALDIGGLRCLAISDQPSLNVFGVTKEIANRRNDLPSYAEFALQIPQVLRLSSDFLKAPRREDSMALSSIGAVTRADATVSEIAGKVAELSGLSDKELAALFRVARETYQRWRTGELTNPTKANRRRLGLLLRLVEDLSRRGVQVREWLRNVSPIEEMTPYDLLARGRLDDVEHLAARIPTADSVKTAVGGSNNLVTRGSNLPAFAPRRNEPTRDLIRDDDDDWVDVEVEAVGDDE